MRAHVWELKTGSSQSVSYIENIPKPHWTTYAEQQTYYNHVTSRWSFLILLNLTFEKLMPNTVSNFVLQKKFAHKFSLIHNLWTDLVFHLLLAAFIWHSLLKATKHYPSTFQVNCKNSNSWQGSRNLWHALRIAVCPENIALRTPSIHVSWSHSIATWIWIINMVFNYSLLSKRSVYRTMEFSYEMKHLFQNHEMGKTGREWIIWSNLPAQGGSSKSI